MAHSHDTKPRHAAEAELDLAALLGSRICHDLISPLGAIGNGLELLSLTGSASAEMSLIAESVANANARVRFYRIAYGTSSDTAGVSRGEVVGVLDDITRGSRLKVRWLPTQAIQRRELKLVFLVIQCLETAMPYGGEIVVSQTEGVWRVHGTATKLKVDPALWDMLLRADAVAELTPAQVQFALVPEVLAATGRRMSLQIRDQDIQASF